MIVLARLDERLIHGQVAIKWSRLLNVDRIIVADDQAASSEIMQKSLMMAAPATVKVAIVPLERAIALCNDPRSEQLKILLVVSTPEALLRIAREIPGIPKLNIGNYGRVAPKRNGRDRKAYAANLYADEEEAGILHEVVQLGIPCVLQTIPDDTPRDLKGVLGF
ncbi:PTS system mannose/fructose/N-acetylgalactosamine-transporter subunit IIB [Collinsella provencensis]|uniref:PTS system mannose/fructose/N-acetylgalactosamine-transporter subunit IIB n=1 Tax=Collinsella provencensis TaxID=1937461 RepID=UPI000C817856|nr:PTS sugar transporter subunit IIB [Collinsella provencensis]